MPIPGSNGTALEVRTRAFNTNGEGPWSDIDRVTPSAISFGNAVPTGTRLDGSEAILWTWTILASAGRDITGYDVQWRVQGSAWAGNTVRVASGCWMQTGQSAGTMIEARVRAISGSEVGPWSNGSAATEVGSAMSTVRQDWLYYDSAGVLLASAVAGTEISLSPSMAGYRYLYVYANTNDAMSRHYPLGVLKVGDILTVRSNGVGISFDGGNAVIEAWGGGQTLTLRDVNTHRTVRVTGIVGVAT